MKLILAEKPSVAKDIAAALNITSGGSGYLQNSEYIVTWAFGHLLQLDPALMPTGNWSFDNLPIMPNKFNYVTTKTTGAQFKIIKDLLKITKAVIIATDAGREGELIARLILNNGGWSDWNNTSRFWSSEALSKEVVLKSLNNLQPASQFESLYQSAICRQHADWLVGINLTQAVSIKANSGTWSIGRVQTPTLRLIVDRDNLRNDFKPEKYFILKANFLFNDFNYDGIFIKDKITSKNQEDNLEEEIGSSLTKTEIENIINEMYNVKNGIIKEVKKEIKKETPPLLHSLTSLQKEANIIFGITAQKTLDIAQELYEKHKCLSYPRTDSQYMAESSIGLVSTVLEKINKSVLISNVNNVGKRVFNDLKLTDHHAIIPLNVAPKDLDKDVQQIYDLIYRKFIGAFMPNYEYETTHIITKLNDFNFATYGKKNINTGWKSLYVLDEKNVLPDLKEGHSVIKNKLDCIEKNTKPTPAFTEATLLAIMEKYTLGTPATRADIIEKLLARNYILRDKKNIISTDKARELILKTINRKFIDPELTGEWEKQLENIVNENSGFKGYNVFLENIKNFVKEEISIIKGLEIKAINLATPKMLSLAKSLAKTHKQKLENNHFEYISDFINQFNKASLGKCSCGSDITEKANSWNCSCGKLIWKEQFKKKLTLKQGIDLMNEKTIELKGCTGSKGKFDCKVKLAVNILKFAK